MLRMRNILLCCVGFLIFLYGCMDLAVNNPNSPNRSIAIASPADVESLIGSSYVQFWWGTQGSTAACLGISTMADIHTSSYGNFGMMDLSSEPRAAINNLTAYSYSADFLTPWRYPYRAASQANDGLVTIAGGMKIIDATTKADNTLRAVAFARFVRGIAHGWLACLYDQAFVVDGPITDATKLTLQPYTEVIKSALADLDSCIAICGKTTFTLPTSWVNGVTVNQTLLMQLAYSYKARYRAGVARTPAERAAVAWTSVMSDAQNGVKADFAPVGDGGNSWYDYSKFYGTDPSWTRADYKLIGLTDTSGRYTTWLNTAVPSRTEFLLATADRRITGATPTTDGTDFGYGSNSPFNATRGTYHYSFYYFSRYKYHRPQWTGAMPVVTVPEMDLLVAEAKVVAGSLTEAAALINKTRVTRGKLPALTGSEGKDVIMKWLKYDKILETMSTAAILGYCEKRGWGDLLTGTALQWPIPGGQLELMMMPNYTFGGGGASSAPKYGFTVGAVGNYKQY
jgi:hypothetical protein